MLDLPTLEGRRCTLRPLQERDAESLQRHADDPAVAFNLFDGFPQPYTLELARTWCSSQHREPAFAHVLGITVPSDQVVGCISVTPEHGIWRCSAVIGYWLGRRFWNQGITSESLTLLSHWAWQALPNTTRLFMPIYARNGASQRVAVKAGYRLEAHLPQAVQAGTETIDAVLYGAYRGSPLFRPDLAARLRAVDTALHGGEWPRPATAT